MYKVSETVLPIYINGQCPIIKTCSDVTLNLSSKDSTHSYSPNGESSQEIYKFSKTRNMLCRGSNISASVLIFAWGIANVYGDFYSCFTTTKLRLIMQEQMSNSTYHMTLKCSTNRIF